MSRLISAGKTNEIILSKQRNTYKLSKPILLQLRKKGNDQCDKCKKTFYENDIVAVTSAKKHYCYECAVKINLVTGNVEEDLCFDAIISETIKNIAFLSSKARIGINIQNLALLILKEAYHNQNSLSKNPIGLAAGAIYLACILHRHDRIDEIIDTFPISGRVVKKNYGILVRWLAI
ncbi:MAG: hypothetical protein ACRD90_05985 [Nitrosopumilaceae archaeon]